MFAGPPADGRSEIARGTPARLPACLQSLSRSASIRLRWGVRPMDEATFAFGSFRLIPSQRMLLDEGKPLRLGSRALDILIALVERAGETVSREQLISRVWPATVVDE